MSRRGLQVNTKCVFDQFIYLLPISKFSYHFPLDLSGYIRQVTPTKNSLKNNPYFDTSVATETSIEQLRVMIALVLIGTCFWRSLSLKLQLH